VGKNSLYVFSRKAKKLEVWIFPVGRMRIFSFITKTKKEDHVFCLPPPPSPSANSRIMATSFPSVCFSLLSVWQAGALPFRQQGVGASPVSTAAKNHSLLIFFHASLLPPIRTYYTAMLT
jgi:hypothetical protein